METDEINSHSTLRMDLNKQSKSKMERKDKGREKH